MATTKERLDGIDKRLNAIGAPLGMPTVSKSPSFWPKTLTEWSQVVGVVLAILVAACGVTLYLGSLMVDKHIQLALKPIQTNIQNIQGDFREIKGRLDELSGRQAKIEIQNYSKLPPQALGAVLPEVKTAITTLRDQNVKVHPKDVDDLSQKLAAVPDKSAPEFWPAAALVISYRSLSLVGNIKNWTANFPPYRFSGNLDASPDAHVQLQTPDGKLGPKIPIERVGSQDCYVDLDGKTLSRWDCTRCLVKFSGGLLKMRDVRFRDCLFVFDFGLTPPSTPDGQRLSEALLTSELRDVSIPAS